MNTKQALQRARTLTGCEPRINTCSITNPVAFAKELNTFFAQLDTLDFTAECDALLDAIPLPEAGKPAPFTEEDVRRQLSRCRLGKTPGLDGIPTRVLKACSQELTPVLHSFFCESYMYQTATIPTLWKTATIIPVPKKPRPTDLNHYRPVALTSIIMKCLEKLLLPKILPVVTPQLDSLQFAYKTARGTEDAVACLLHLIRQHLDSPHHFIRILFVDFSSAFKTIQKHLMIQKLHQLNTQTD